MDTPSLPMQPVGGRRILAIVAWAGVGLGVILMALGWVRCAGHGSWQTGAHVVTWYGPGGELLEGGCSFRSSDSAVIDGDQMWFTCGVTEGRPDERYGYGALAVLDVQRGEGRILWEAPAGLVLYKLVGVLPGSEGGLGIVYASVGGELAAAVAGPEGWRIEPIPLSDERDTKLMGMAWVEDKLEVVVQPHVLFTSESSTRRDPQIITVAESVTTRAMPRDTLCRNARPCAAEIAYYDRETRSWTWFVDDFRGERDDRIRVNERGETIVSGEIPDVLGFEGQTEWLAAGLINTIDMPWRFSPDGSFAKSPANPPGLTGRASTGDFVVGAGQLNRRRMWLPRHEYAYEVEGRVIGVRGSGAPGDDLLQLREGDGPWRIVGWFGDCQLAFPSFLPDAQGGLTLVNGDGCHLRVDKDLRRTDPLSIEEHLSRRGSGGYRSEEQRHIWLLWWVLLALPLLLLLALSISMLPAFRDKAIRTKAVLAAAFIYLATATYAHIGFFDVMR